MAILPSGWLLGRMGEATETPVPPPTGDDPFTLVYEAIWFMLLQNPHFEEGVKEGNRITFVPAVNRNLNKKFVDSKLSTDYPEVRVVVEGATPAIVHDSSSTKITRAFGIIVSTNDVRLNEGLFPIEWEVVKAMANWRSNLSQLEWQGEKFIKRLVALPTSTSMSITGDGYPNGWASVWRVSVDMYFSTAQLASYV
jgi:hypothetical protein